MNVNANKETNKQAINLPLFKDKMCIFKEKKNNTHRGKFTKGT
jgi:hypothetical protein